MRSERHPSLARPLPRRKPLLAALLAALGAPTTAALADGRLPLPQPSVVFATLGRASYSTSGVQGLVKQLDDRVILNWDSFDIAADHRLRFDQPAATSIALNRINERTRPSRILGELSANGQVYLYNPNGIVFGRGARVDTNTLVATTLDVADDVIRQGLTKPALSGGLPAFSAVDPTTNEADPFRRDEHGNVLRDGAGLALRRQIAIEQGAKLTTNAPNGRILVLAPSIVNAGEVSAERGQVLMAAATDKVYLTQADSNATGIRGLLVEVDTGGDVTNLGSIATPAGNTTLAGYAVNQRGRVSATTTVNLNGSIVLKAAEGAQVQPNADGTVTLRASSTARTPTEVAQQDDGLGAIARVTLGAGSVTEVRPDVADATTAVDEQTQSRSRIDVLARAIDVGAGAQLVAPSGRIELVATAQPLDPSAETTSAADARITLGAGSRVDVAGLAVAAPIERNEIQVQLFSNELRDAPLQKGGLLFGRTITIDARKGTPLADVSGALARLPRTVAERSTAGGSVSLRAAGAVTLAAGATIDVSGGSVHYGAGTVNSTQLVAADGRIVDISEADPTLRYVAILDDVQKTYATWGITKRWHIPGPLSFGRYEPAYAEGRDGGRLDFVTPSLTLDGRLVGRTFDGITQRSPATRAGGSRLSIDQRPFADGNQRFLFSDTPSARAADLLHFDGDWARDAGFRHLDVATNGEVGVAPGTTIALDDGGSFALSGGSARVDGVIDVAGGDVAIASLAGDLALGASARIDVRGTWTNDAPAPGTRPAIVDGGSISLAATGDLSLAAGSVLDVSGGAWRAADGTLLAGGGGEIALSAVRQDRAARVTLGASLRGYGLEHGGRFILKAPAITIGGGGAADADALALTDEFFARGGFATFELTANRGDLRIGAGAHIVARQDNWVLDPASVPVTAARSLDGLAHVARLPLAQRAPVDLRFAVVLDAPGAASDAALRFAADGAIDLDPAAQLAFVGERDLFLDGDVIAPSGDILAQLAAPTLEDVFGNAVAEPPFRADQGIWIGADSRWSTRGIALYAPSASGRREGRVLAGGDIRLQADRGYVIVAAGALLDASGAAGIYDEAVMRARGPGLDYVPTLIGSDAGSVTLAAAEGIVLDGALRANGGAAPGTAGGRLGVTLTTEHRDADPLLLPTYPTAPRTIRLDAPAHALAPLAIGAGSDVPLARNGLAALDVARLAAAGFDAFDLRADDAIAFNGDVALRAARRIVLDAPSLKVGPAAGRTRLDAPYVALGSSLLRAVPTPPTAGAATLEISADLIDLVGALGISGQSSVTLASRGDLRLRGIARGASDLRGELAVAANLGLSATQIYPTTFSNYAVSVLGGPSTRLVTTRVGSDSPVLSAAGAVSFSAPTIVHAGAVKAPAGSVSFTAGDSLTLAPGSLISVSLEGQRVPFGRTLGGLEWIYPLDGKNPIQASAPAASIDLRGERVDFAAGARLDLAGGGELQAYEFVKGPGGSIDLLDPNDPGYTSERPYTPVYAVLPGFDGHYAPYDYALFEDAGLTIGDRLEIGAGSGLAPGSYTLLPAHYALLPGAFLVTPLAGVDAPLGARSVDAAGQPIVAGFRSVAGTSIRSARPEAFLVEPGSNAGTRAEYDVSLASEFFTARDGASALRPADAGRLTLAATESLSLRGLVNASAAAGGRGAAVDIAGDRFALVDRRGRLGDADARIELVAGELAALGIDSLFIGGTRRVREADTLLEIGTRSLEVLGGVSFAVPELLLGARERLVVADGATLASTARRVDAGAYAIDGDAALVRVAAGDAATVSHGGALAGTARLELADGARVSTRGAAQLLSSGDSVLDGALDLHGGTLEIGAGAIALGDAPAGTPGVVIDGARLNALGADTLILSSRGSIDLHGALTLALSRLELRAAGLRGIGGGARTIAAEAIELANPVGGNVAAAAADGTLVLDAARLSLGTGDFTLAGFAAQTLRADAGLHFSGDGALEARGALSLETSAIGGAAAATRTLAARDGATLHDLQIHAAGQADLSFVAPELGASLTLVGDEVGLDGTLLLPAGRVDVDAAGRFTLGANGVVDLAGRTIVFADRRVHADGGRLDVVAGEIHTQTGSLISVAASADGGHAGRVGLRAIDGALALQGRLIGHAASDAHSGRLAVDVADGSLLPGATLARLVADGGFHRGLDVRARSGDLIVAADDTLRALDLALVADAGRIDVAGTLDASGAVAGSLTLAGGQGVELRDGATLLARASEINARGGRVLLDGVGGQGTSGGAVNIATGARIDVTGGAALRVIETTLAGELVYGLPGPVVQTTSGERLSGDITLRARRTASGVNANVAGTLDGAATPIAEAVRVYELGASASLGTAAMNGYKADTDAYMATASAPRGDLRLQPGIELRTSGALALTTPWNLADWRYGERPGSLSLRAGGDLTLTGAITDGFRSEVLDVPDGAGGSFTRTLANALQSDESWSLRLVAGADLASADVLDTREGAGALILSNGAFVRTGTGDIAVAAGGDLRLADDRSAIYTAGRRLPLSATLGAGNPYGSLGLLMSLFYAEYPIDGGDVAIDVRGDINGAVRSTSSYTVGSRTVTATTHQFITDWLMKTGAGLDYTAWGIALDQPSEVPIVANAAQVLNARSGFRQNVGALGGGRIDIAAAGDVRNLSVILPTTGKPIGERSTPQDPTSTGFARNAIEINGGGSLSLSAGGDIVGGLFLIDGGTARLTAGGRVTGGDGFASGSAIAAGDARIEIAAVGDVSLGAVFDPGLLTPVYATNPNSPATYFVRYADDSAIDLVSLGGDVTLANDTTMLAQRAVRFLGRQVGANVQLQQQQYLRFTEFLALAPPRLSAAALSGEIEVARSFTLLPAPRGSLDLLAAGDLSSGEIGNRVIVNLSDAARDSFPSVLAPAGGLARQLGVLTNFDLTGLSHAATPIHLGDPEPARIVSLHGDIRADDELVIALAKAAIVSAGRDLFNLDLDFQHVAAGDLTRVEAGRDIRYVTRFDADTGALVTQSQEILISGPGRLELVAGRDLDLGAANGVTSVGSARNPALGEQGASLGLYAGFGNTVDYAAYAEAALARGADALFIPALYAALAEATGQRPTSVAAAHAQLFGLPAARRRALLDAVFAVDGRKALVDTFFAELRAAGTAAARSGDYGPGLAAIATLFPERSYDGDLRLFFSKVHTLAGGDIDFLVPGGLVNAGLAVSSLSTKAASELGIVAQQGGAVNVFAHDDVQVNASRVFALGGDDITIWSTTGDIDAGRGAKAALSVPPPIVSYDANGNLRIEFPPVVSGSGIRTASSRPGVDPGDVYLFAVDGIVDAGEAGIGGNNIVIAANAVVGASNIDVGGTAIGVPVAANVSVAAGLGNVSNVVAGAAQLAEQASSEQLGGRAEQALAQRFRPTLVSAEVVGFGDWSVGDIREGRHATGAAQ